MVLKELRSESILCIVDKKIIGKTDMDWDLATLFFYFIDIWLLFIKYSSGINQYFARMPRLWEGEQGKSQS